VTTVTTPTRERSAFYTTTAGTGGGLRRADDRRSVLVSATLATIRGGGARRPGERSLERARAALSRMRAMD
jgi:hypothetical protein